MYFLIWVSGVSLCIQHFPRIPSQLEMRELGTGVIPLFSLNVATIMATINFFFCTDGAAGSYCVDDWVFENGMGEVESGGSRG